MTRDELLQLLPDLVDGVELAPPLLAEVEAALIQYPDCQQELEIARQVRAFLVQLQAENAQLRLPANFEARLLARVRRQEGYLELFDLSSKAFVQWLLELISLLGGLLPQAPTTPRSSLRVE